MGRALVDIQPASERERRLWHALLDISERRRTGWTLIGAQMVTLHGLEQGIRAPRASLDADILANARITGGVRAMAKLLSELDFTMADPDPFGVSHRFARDPVVIDVLAPDGVGPRTPIETIPPARTVQVPGGTQAMRRTELVDVSVDGRAGVIPRPNLLGAILVKARAVEVDDVRDAQIADVAFLLSLVTNPRELSGGLARAERSWLRKVVELSNPRHLSWTLVQHSTRGQRALAVLASVGGSDDEEY